jgi:hypothetical protein
MTDVEKQERRVGALVDERQRLRADAGPDAVVLESNRRDLSASVRSWSALLGRRHGAVHQGGAV